MGQYQQTLDEYQVTFLSWTYYTRQVSLNGILRKNSSPRASLVSRIARNEMSLNCDKHHVSVRLK